MSKRKSAGSVANGMGRAMENSVEDQLIRAGFAHHNEKKTKDAFVRNTVSFGDEALGDRWFMRNLKKYENMYKVRFFSDFVVYDRAVFPHGLVIEVKAQETPGSVDEKYVFTVLSLKQLYDNYGKLSAWLVFGGTGLRPCAADWMKEQEKWSQRRQQFMLLTEGQFRRALFDSFANDTK